MYEIFFSKQAKKFLVKINKKDYSLISKHIQKLSKEIFPKGSKKLIDVVPPAFRIRVKNFRVLYIINFKEKEIFISKIDKRSKIYK